jgi:hypothetical protein
VERVIVKTLEEAPRGATHWPTRSMAEKGNVMSGLPHLRHGPVDVVFMWGIDLKETPSVVPKWVCMDGYPTLAHTPGRLL